MTHMTTPLRQRNVCFRLDMAYTHELLILHWSRPILTNIFMPRVSCPHISVFRGVTLLIFYYNRIYLSTTRQYIIYLIISVSCEWSTRNLKKRYICFIEKSFYFNNVLSNSYFRAICSYTLSLTHSLTSLSLFLSLSLSLSLSIYIYIYIYISNIQSVSEDNGYGFLCLEYMRNFI